MIAYTLTSSGQSTNQDSLICFSIEEAKKIALITSDYFLIEEQANICDSLLVLQENRYKILKSDYSILRDKNMKLTERLNQEEEKRKKARKSRLIWGAVGSLVGIIIYNMVVK